MRKIELKTKRVISALALAALALSSRNVSASELESAGMNIPGYLNLFSMFLVMAGLAGYFLRRGSRRPLAVTAGEAEERGGGEGDSVWADSGGDGGCGGD